jgi:integrase
MKNGLPFVQPMHEELAEQLAKHRKALGRVPSKDEPVIPDAEALDVKTSWKGVLTKAKLRDRGFRPHDLRHTFVSWLGESCTHAVMQKLAGHAATNITDRYGQHQELEVLRAGINSLKPLLGKPARVAGKVRAAAPRARESRAKA